MQHVTSLPDMIPRLMQQQSTYLNEQMQVLRRLAMDDVQRTCVMAASLRKDVHAKVSKSSLPLPLAYLAKVQAEGPQSVVVGGSGFALPNSADEPLVSFVEACELVDSVTTTLERDGQARKFLVMEAFKLQQQFRQQNQQPKQHGIDLEQNAEFEESVDRLIDQWRILDPTSMLQHVSFTLELLNSPQGL